MKKNLAKKLKGLQTVTSIQKALGVKRKTAINYISMLRKGSYVKTTRGKGKVRMYEISDIPMKELGYPGLYDIINSNSPIKIVKPYEHRVYSRMSIEEAITKAIETKDFRVILASLALFQKVKSWSLLYKFAKRSGIQRQVGALYELSRRIIKVRRMDKRVRNALIRAKIKSKFIVPHLKSKDFKDIEKEWKVFIPFKKSDLERYKE